MMISLFRLTYFSEKERDVVIATIDSTPYKDLIVGNKSHVIRYRKTLKQKQSGDVRKRLEGLRRISTNCINHNIQSYR